MTRWDRCRTKSRACGLNVDVVKDTPRGSETDQVPYEALYLRAADNLALPNGGEGEGHAGNWIIASP